MTAKLTMATMAERTIAERRFLPTIQSQNATLSPSIAIAGCVRAAAPNRAPAATDRHCHNVPRWAAVRTRPKITGISKPITNSLVAMVEPAMWFGQKAMISGASRAVVGSCRALHVRKAT